MDLPCHLSSGRAAIRLELVVLTLLRLLVVAEIFRSTNMRDLLMEQWQTLTHMADDDARIGDIVAAVRTT
jgi:hypothetical protein